MPGFTNFAENKLIDFLFRGQAAGNPATWHFALFTSDPTETGGGTEVTGGGYARVALAASLANFAGTQGAGTTTASTGTGGLTSNNVAVTFPVPSGAWSGGASITHMALMDASTGGNAWIAQALVSPKTVNNGDPAPSFPIADFTHSID